MNAILICPAGRRGVAGLAEQVPLSNVPVLGKPVVEYWLEHLVALGVKNVHLLAADRPGQVRALIGTGARWGLQAVVHPETRESTPDEACARFPGGDGETWLPLPCGATVMDHLPERPDLPLFGSYAGFFSALQAALPQAATDRVGVREIRPGVWVGRGSRIAPSAELRGPCWLGENVYIGSGARVGPMAVIESRTLIEPGAEVCQSLVGPETLVGRFTEIRHSIAWGRRLANWRLDSCIEVPDAFLLCPMTPPRGASCQTHLIGRCLAALVLLLTVPIFLPVILAAKRRHQPALRRRLAVRPRSADDAGVPVNTVHYHELAGVPGLLRRWPQLWSITRGDFAWVGNRPLGLPQAARLTTDFERLWLDAPLGLISLADAEGCHRFLDDDSRIHSSFYATHANWRLDLAILARMLFLVVAGLPYSRVREFLARALRPGSDTQRRAN